MAPAHTVPEVPQTLNHAPAKVSQAQKSCRRFAAENNMAGQKGTKQNSPIPTYAHQTVQTRSFPGPLPTLLCPGTSSTPNQHACHGQDLSPGLNRSSTSCQRPTQLLIDNPPWIVYNECTLLNLQLLRWPSLPGTHAVSEACPCPSRTNPCWPYRW